VDFFSRMSPAFNGKRERWVRLVSPVRGSRTFSGVRASNPRANTSCCAAWTTCREKFLPLSAACPSKRPDSDTLVATHMNGSPLERHHGFPARALVPGWIGAASCKWLSEIKVLDQEFDGNFMKPGYRLPNHSLKPGEPLNLDNSHVVTALNVKSVIAAPTDGAILPSRAFDVQGAAWAGEAEIVKVEVSTDEGATWQATRLDHEQEKYARLWTYPVKVSSAGEYTILARAIDNQGGVQPRAAEWNPSGYLYNAIDQVTIHVQT
jgi:sulfite oxidase